MEAKTNSKQKTDNASNKQLKELQEKYDNIANELKTTRTAFLMACAKVAELQGDCHKGVLGTKYCIFDENYCEKHCLETEKYLCWDAYFMQKAKEGKNDT